ncbi:MAG: AmmeMemoRadiSam system protein B [Armatimonadota bacterium]|nr:AmmeMemoRadiSam system protein B [Armatimonadota bacterium]
MSRVVRPPAVAGYFYEGDPSRLRRQIEECFSHPIGPGSTPEVRDGPRFIVGLVCPHAGYPYSGPVAAWAYKVLAEDGRPDVVVILGPDHRGAGSDVSVAPEDAWQTPLGEVPIHLELRDKLLKEGLVTLDGRGHRFEHSLEVQVPFLQYLYGALAILPIALADQRFPTCEQLGVHLARVLTGKNAVIVASSDFSHYLPHRQAMERDRLAIKAILDLNPKALMEVVEGQGVTMCGPGAVVAMLTASSLLGAERAELLRYATSGDTAGDREEVVGYAAIAIRRSGR